MGGSLGFPSPCWYGRLLLCGLDPCVLAPPACPGLAASGSHRFGVAVGLVVVSALVLRVVSGLLASVLLVRRGPIVQCSPRGEVGGLCSAHKQSMRVSTAACLDGRYADRAPHISTSTAHDVFEVACAFEQHRSPHPASVVSHGRPYRSVVRLVATWRRPEFPCPQMRASRLAGRTVQ